MGGDNTTIDTDAVIAVITDQDNFVKITASGVSFKQCNILSLMLAASAPTLPTTFICLLYSESEGVLLLHVMLFSYQGVLLHSPVPLSQRCLL